MSRRSRQVLQQAVLDGTGRIGLTFLIMMGLVLLSVLPLGLKGYGDVRPAFVVMAVYYWAIYRPYMLSLGGTFCVGLFLDLLMGGPFGLQALVLVLVRSITASQQKFMLAQRFGVVWGCFGLVAVSSALLQWFVFGVLNLEFTALKPVLVSACVSACVFPAVALPLYMINRAMDHRDIFRS